jgi:dTMP kinase
MAGGRKRKRGLFVTFEGIDGCGKSTQMANACRYLRAQGYSVSRLREPGSTPAAERIRNILLDPKSSLSDIAELLLYEAARAEIVAREIRPALAAGHIVLCDRFFDSTTAYQGYGRKLDIRMVRRLHRIAVGDVVPDLTLVLDVNLNTAYARRGKRPDRLESQSRAFFNRVRRGFLEIAAREPRRVKVIDSSRPINDVFADIARYLKQRLAR